MTKCYSGETNRPLEVLIKEGKCNLTQGLLEKSKCLRRTQNMMERSEGFAY
jgi:hypothetical protein